MPATANHTLKSNGFSLIELLVAMAIMAILISVAALSLGRGFGSSVFKEESRRLEALIQLASEEAILFNKSLGVRFDSNAYSFYELTRKEISQNADNQTTAATNPFLPNAGSAQQSSSTKPKYQLLWEEIEGDRYFQLRELPEDYVFNVILDGLEINLDVEDFKGDTFNVDNEEQLKEIKPHIFLTPDGEIFPDLEIRITTDEVEDSYGVVELDEEGDLSSKVFKEST